MHTQKPASFTRGQDQRLEKLFRTTLLFTALATSLARSITLAQAPSRPWMDRSLSAEERAARAIEQMTLDEKLALLHGNGMGHVGRWQMPLTYLGNGGAGYVSGVPRRGIPGIVMSDAAYGVRDSGANGR